MPNAGLLAVGQFHRPYQRDSLFPYSYISASPQNHSSLPSKSLDRTPIPSRTWQSSLGVVPGHKASTAFPDKGIAFPIFQRLPTEVTYTLQSSASPVPLQQVSQAIATSPAKYSSYASPLHYSQAYYPTGKKNNSKSDIYIDIDIFHSALSCVFQWGLEIVKTFKAKRFSVPCLPSLQTLYPLGIFHTASLLRLKGEEKNICLQLGSVSLTSPFYV